MLSMSTKSRLCTALHRADFTHISVPTCQYRYSHRPIITLVSLHGNCRAYVSCTDPVIHAWYSVNTEYIMTLIIFGSKVFILSTYLHAFIKGSVPKKYAHTMCIINTHALFMLFFGIISFDLITQRQLAT